MRKYKPGDVVVYSIPAMSMNGIFKDNSEFQYIIIATTDEQNNDHLRQFYGFTYLALTDEGCYFFNAVVFEKYTRLAHG